ncbi:MAG: hypothetical protein JW956_00820 [Calditrichaceae bacterium]|nr:hypothetical protein [Calditrichaceae bacterium]
MSKIIIGIHGLGNKPPKEILESWWKQSIREGFRKIGQPRVLFNFELVYWADILYAEPLNLEISDPEDPLYVHEPYLPGRYSPSVKEVPLKSKLIKYLEKQMDKLFLNADMTLNFESITDKILHRYFKDLETYYSAEPIMDGEGQALIRDQIRGRLANVLVKHRNKDILLLSHSMGSIIAYDVLAHTVPHIEIDTFVTAGSPLGLPIIIGRIFAEQKKRLLDETKVLTPENVKHAWYNFTDPEDHIAIDATLNDDYTENSRGIRAIDMVVHTDYAVKEERNAHKSYGYLRAPEMIEILDEFLNRGKLNLLITYQKKLNYYFSRFIEKYL